jgi:hypothetical protein
MKEVLKQGISTPLLVLAACKSHSGRLLPTGEAASLANQFLVSGAGGVVGTLWDLTVDVHNFVLDRFYQRLNNGETIAAALRGAKLDYLEQCKDRLDPYYWGCIQYVGRDLQLFQPSGPRVIKGFKDLYGHNVSGRVVNNVFYYFNCNFQRYTLVKDWQPDPNISDWILKAGTEVWLYYDGRLQHFTLAKDWQPNPNISDLELKAGTEVWKYPDGQFQRFTLARYWQPYPGKNDWVLKAGTDVWKYPDGKPQRFTLAVDWPYPDKPDLVLKAGTEVWLSPDGNLQHFTLAKEWYPYPDKPDLVLKAGTEVWLSPDGNLQHFKLAKEWYPSLDKPDLMIRAYLLPISIRSFHGS